MSAPSPAPARTGSLRELVADVLSGTRLHGARADEALAMLCAPDADRTLQAALLAALRARGEDAVEVASLARALQSRAVGPLEVPVRPLVDTCGTGGDGSDSVNLSTLAALVAAAAGATVAKHGNRGVSSRCGSADLAAALELPLHEHPGTAAVALGVDGFAFLFAPAFHPAAGAVAAARRALGARTVFNLLGPLANPARPTHQVVGACDVPTAHLLAAALAHLDVERAFVVHGEPGWDEATPCGPFLRLDVAGGSVEERHVDPRTYGLPRCAPADLAGGDATRNAAIARALLAGERGAVRDAVLLNAALALEVAGLEAEPTDALARAAHALDSGATAALVARLAGAEVER